MYASNNSSLSSLNEDEYITTTSALQKADLLKLPSTSGYSSSTSDENIVSVHAVPSKTLIEAQYIGNEDEIREDDEQDSVGSPIKGRVLRTPSIIVSDYSDDVLDILQKHIQIDNDVPESGTLSFSDSSPNYSSSDEIDNDDSVSDNGKTNTYSKLTPFVQRLENNCYQWVQLAGHKNSFRSGPDSGTILKRTNDNEYVCFQNIQKDTFLKHFVPEYKGRILIDNGYLDLRKPYLQLQDLLSEFDNPCVMDCKIGIRTILEDDLIKANERHRLRGDMYVKMVNIDPEYPTEQEHRTRAVTKSRYMLWRESISSTSTYGFRIEGLRRPFDRISNRNFKLTKTFEELYDVFKMYLEGYDHAIEAYFRRLNDIKSALLSSEFFHKHEFIGSSLLFVHDNTKANIWLIDFAKTVPVPESVHVTHHDQWVFGNHEDGYLIGIDNILKILEEIFLKFF